MMNTRALTWIGLLCVASCSAPNGPPLAQPSDTMQTDSVRATEDDPKPIVDGKYLYTRNCAGCHNDNGDGLGATIVQLGQRARNFAEGHFAFGNTRESIFRTIASGVPGRSPMPGFAGVLSEDERWLVVDYVRTLMPAEVEADSSAGVLRVSDAPRIVRGLLPPIVEGAPERPRGVLIGMPGGLTFEYRTDDVRLLGVRQGDFADRRDWNDRGGAALKPLGQTMYSCERGDPRPSIALIRDEARMPLAARLKSSWIRGAEAGLTYEWTLAPQNIREWVGISVEEACRMTPLPLGAGFTRRFKLRSARAASAVWVNVAGRAPDEQWIRGASGAATAIVGLPTFELPADGWVVGQCAPDDFECIHLRAPPGSRIAIDTGTLGVIVSLPAETDVALEATIVTTADGSSAQIERLSKEIR